MTKYLLIASLVLLSGCSRYEFNASMCEDISPKSDPSLIEKCRNYNEAEATKAMNKKSKKNVLDKEDIIQYNKKD